MNREKLFEARKRVHESLLAKSQKESMFQLRLALDTVIDLLLEESPPSTEQLEGSGKMDKVKE